MKQQRFLLKDREYNSIFVAECCCTATFAVLVIQPPTPAADFQLLRHDMFVRPDVLRKRGVCHTVVTAMLL